jgi:hypothetical protein
VERALTILKRLLRVGHGFPTSAERSTGFPRPEPPRAKRAADAKASQLVNLIFSVNNRAGTAAGLALSEVADVSLREDHPILVVARLIGVRQSRTIALVAVRVLTLMCALPAAPQPPASSQPPLGPHAAVPPAQQPVSAVLGAHASELRATLLNRLESDKSSQLRAALFGLISKLVQTQV